MGLPHDPFFRVVALPATFDRARRVALLAELADALLEGRTPSHEAALFVGGGLQGWLREGGDLVRDFWQVKARRGSHETPQALARLIAMSDSCADTDQHCIPTS